MHQAHPAFRTSRFVILLSLGSTLTSCAALQDAGGGVPGGPACPGSVSEIASANFGLAADAEAKVKASLSAAATISGLADKVEGDVVAACSGLALDLGAKEADLQPKASGPGEKAKAACAAATAAIEAFKVKAAGAFSVKAQPPECRASIDVYADCAGKCDASVTPGKASVQCEEGHLSGGCEGKCEGTCAASASGKCSGECSGSCSGSCDAEFSGKCGGRCEGMCDGKDVKGACKGVCDGKCTAKAEGTCLGKCSGECSASCQVEAKGKCEGTCTGKCDVEMKAPKCDAVVTPPEMSAECKASCDADASAKLECTPATVSIVLYGVTDVKAAETFRAALTKNLPALLKVTLGMKGAITQAVAGVDGMLDGVKGAVSGGGAAALHAGACVAAAVTAQAQASAKISVSVEASASASGEVTSL